MDLNLYKNILYCIFGGDKKRAIKSIFVFANPKRKLNSIMYYNKI